MAHSTPPSSRRRRAGEPPRERELLILRIGYLRGSEYEWWQHTRIARNAGVTDDEILRVIEGPEAAEWSPFDRALLRAVDELHHDAEISDGTWNDLAARYDSAKGSMGIAGRRRLPGEAATFYRAGSSSTRCRRRNASVRGQAFSVARRLASRPSWAFRKTVAPS